MTVLNAADGAVLSGPAPSKEWRMHWEIYGPGRRCGPSFICTPWTASPRASCSGRSASCPCTPPPMASSWAGCAWWGSPRRVGGSGPKHSGGVRPAGRQRRSAAPPRLHRGGPHGERRLWKNRISHRSLPPAHPAAGRRSHVSGCLSAVQGPAPHRPGPGGRKGGMTHVYQPVRRGKAAARRAHLCPRRPHCDRGGQPGHQDGPPGGESPTWTPCSPCWAPSSPTP